MKIHLEILNTCFLHHFLKGHPFRKPHLLWSLLGNPRKDAEIWSCKLAENTKSQKRDETAIDVDIPGNLTYWKLGFGKGSSASNMAIWGIHSLNWGYDSKPLILMGLTTPCCDKWMVEHTKKAINLPHRFMWHVISWMFCCLKPVTPKIHCVFKPQILSIHIDTFEAPWKTSC